MSDTTPADTIQAAIDKLERLRGNALSGPLEVDTNYPFSSDIVGLFAPQARRYAIKSDSGASGQWDDDDEPIDDEDAPHRATLHLLVTLHATIDAQLAILRFGLDGMRQAVRVGFTAETIESIYEHQLLLARAILGEDA